MYAHKHTNIKVFFFAEKYFVSLSVRIWISDFLVNIEKQEEEQQRKLKINCKSTYHHRKSNTTARPVLSGYFNLLLFCVSSWFRRL
jgi:hypothetical protein